MDWEIPDTDGAELRTIWEVSLGAGYPRLISVFLKRAKLLEFIWAVLSKKSQKLDIAVASLVRT